MKKSALKSRELLGQLFRHNLPKKSSVNIGRYGIHQPSGYRISNEGIKPRGNESSLEIYIKKPNDSKVPSSTATDGKLGYFPRRQ